MPQAADAEAAVPAALPHARAEFARTDDGWDIALHRYVNARQDLPPVILCSGYSCNRHFLDADERYSLARFLARRGFDVWVLELRGHGYSEPIGALAARDWTFDDFVRFDLPAAVRYVRGRCDGRRPVWVGHSLGGIVMYAALGEKSVECESLAALVTIASPIAFPAVVSPAVRGLAGFFLALPWRAKLPQGFVLRVLWSASSLAPSATGVGMNPRNVDRAAFGRAFPKTICDVPSGVLRQLAQWSLSGEFRSSDGRLDYRARLSDISTATLVIAGAADRVAPPNAVRVAYDFIAAARKAYRQFGVSSGDSADYGHIDLVFGRRAPEEVFPVIGEWIETEAAAARGMN